MNAGRNGHAALASATVRLGSLCISALARTFGLGARAGMDGARDHDALAPEGPGKASTPLFAHTAARSAAGREMRASHADERGVAQGVERHQPLEPAHRSSCRPG